MSAVPANGASAHAVSPQPPWPPASRPVWRALCAEADALGQAETLLRPWLVRTVLASDGLGQALSRLLAGKLCTSDIAREPLGAALAQAFAAAPGVLAVCCRDLQAIVERDPSTDDLLTAFLFHKGFHALQTHRAAHWHWHQRRRGLAALLQNRASEVFAVDIHPAARIGSGVFIDHATGVVIGETTVVGDDVSMLQDVTLGGTGKDKGDRHPKVGRGVLLCAGAKVLGNITLGDGARVGAGSVVLHHVAPHTTVVGVPARATLAARAVVELQPPAHEVSHEP